MLNNQSIHPIQKQSPTSNTHISALGRDALFIIFNSINDILALSYASQACKAFRQLINTPYKDNTPSILTRNLTLHPELTQQYTSLLNQLTNAVPNQTIFTEFPENTKLIELINFINIPKSSYKDLLNQLHKDFPLVRKLSKLPPLALSIIFYIYYQSYTIRYSLNHKLMENKLKIINILIDLIKISTAIPLINTYRILVKLKQLELPEKEILPITIASFILIFLIPILIIEFLPY